MGPSVRVTAIALPLLLALSGCSSTGSEARPDRRQSPPPTGSVPASPDTEVEDAPPGYGARLTVTEGRGNVLSVRTLGSSSCPFEIGSVRVSEGVIEVADTGNESRDVPCTADRTRSTDYVTVAERDFDVFRSARSVILTDDVGQRLRLDLNFAVE